MKLLWSDEALTELSAIMSYIAKDNPTEAETLAEYIYTETELLLKAYPRTGRIGRVKNTFELVIHKWEYRNKSGPIPHVKKVTPR